MLVSRRFGLAIGLLGLALLLTATMRGCGPTEPSVSGTVTLDGEPLVTGSIRFVPFDGTPGSDAGTTIDEGRYQISHGLTVGQYTVELQAIRRDPTRRVAAPIYGLMYDEVEVVPPEYNENSTLTRSVKAGDNTLDFHLKSSQDTPGETSR